MFLKIYEFLKSKGLIKGNKDLSLLEPLVSSKVLEAKYYTNWIRQIFLFLFTFLIFIFLVVIFIAKEPKYREFVERNEMGGGSRYYELRGVWENKKEEKFQIEVPPKQLNSKEFSVYVERLERELPTVIKGENPSLREVSNSLYLPETYLYSEIRLSYEYDSRYIGYQGEVLDFPEDEKEMKIKVTCHYENMEKSFELDIRLIQGIQEDKSSLKDEVQALVGQEMNQKTIRLPQEIEGERITFLSRDWSILPKIIFGGLLVGVLIQLLMKQNIDTMLKKRKIEIEKDYGEVVIGLMLFIGAGYSLRRAIEMIVIEYRRKKIKRYLYEELERAYRELEGGVSESIVYQSLGERSRSNLVLRLTEILSGYLKKGNQGLVNLLEEEAKSAMEQRKLLAIKEGEEVSIKLLGPMMGMLFVVLVLLMFPAFLQFQI